MSAALRRTTAAVAAAFALATAHAGRPCDERPPTVHAVTQGLALGERTARALDASGAEVVLLARAGQDLSPYRLRWSHLAFAYRVKPPEGDAPGTWRVVHKLNHCGSDRAGLYRQGLGDFFLDSPHRFEAAYAVLRPDVAQRLRPVLAPMAAAGLSLRQIASALAAAGTVNRKGDPLAPVQVSRLLDRLSLRVVA